MKQVLWVLSFFWIFTGLVYSQNLTWEEARSLSQKNNPSLRASRSQIESSQAKVRAALGDFLPQLTGSGSYAKSNTATSLESEEDYALSLTAQQSLFSGFKSKASLDSSRVNLAIARLELAVLESQIFRDLRVAFISVLYSKEEIELLKKIYARKEENKKLIELRYEGGRENRGTFLRVIAQEAQAKFEVERSVRAYRLTLRNLAQWMGQDGPMTYEILGDLEEKKIAETSNFINLATQHPTYKKSEFTLKGAHASLRESRSSFFPSLSMSATGRRKGSDFPPKSDSWSVGASISYPLFSGGKDYFSIAQSKLEIEKSTSELEKIRRELEFNLESSYIDLENAYSQSEVQKQFLRSAEERATVARSQYSQGLISYQDWDLIETDLTNVQKQALESLKSVALARADWIKAQGKGDD